MRKILISWLAIQNDFARSDNGMQVNKDGPTYLYHQHFYEYEQHILLSSAPHVDTNVAGVFMENCLHKDFPNHIVQIRYLNIVDVLDWKEIYQKVLPVVLEFKDYEIDLFFSPGTVSMRLVWFMMHQSLGLNTQLIQTRKPAFGKRRLPERLYMEIQRDTLPSSLIIRQESRVRSLQQLPTPKQFYMTDSLKKLYEQAFKVAQTDVTCLLLGESGTGKEHLAQYIHQESFRKDLPFVTVNCAAMRDDLLESRLFGHKKGSFTGAVNDHVGLFEMANGGTIFLDEIGDISLYMQQSLLRVLQENEIQPIGSKTKKIDVRIIAATNKDLAMACAAGTFRWDLYYRLSIVDLELPSLRSFSLIERKQLIQFLMKQFAKVYNNKIVLDFNLEQRLLAYPFWGNIRELENLLERFFVLGKETVGVELLPTRFHEQASSFPTKLAEVERLHIQRVLEMYNHKLTPTAEALGIALNTLKKKIADL